MGLNQFQLVITVVALAFGGWWCDGCLEQEKDALLKIQTSFSYTAEELPCWGNDADCCNWESVKCDSVTGRVVELFLPVFFTQLWKEDMNPYLNVSLFLPFDELRSLDLGYHGFVGCVEDGGFERLAGLHHLEELLLERNYFDNGILTSVSSISSLKLLNFSSNALKGTISLQELNNLTNLEHLDLGHNEIEGFKSFQGDEDILNLSKLESLNLGSNCLNNNILSFINNLPSLKNLDISYNRLQEGSFEMKELNSLINLEELDLSGNKIKTFVGSKGFNKLSTLFLNNASTNSSSILLQSLEAFSFLQTLYLQENNFEGRPIFHPDSHSLMKLKELYLDASNLDEKSLENLETALPSLKILSLQRIKRPLSFQGPTFKHLEELSLTGSTVNISFLQTVGTMTALKRLYLSKTSLNGTLPATQGLCNLKNIQELDFESAGLTGTLPVCLFNLTHLKSLLLWDNNLSGPLSASLANLTSLQYLYLSGNNLLRGDFPYWLLENNRELKVLNLDNCSFSGPLRLPNQPHLNLTYLYISYNRFHGQIPEEVGIIFPGLNVLAMSRNAFHGRLPSSFGNMTSLENLDISDNSLSGEIPSSLAFGCFLLRSLELSNNNLEGQIFSSGFSYTSLVDLRLDGNQFTGTIPDGLSNLSSILCTMDLRHNRITGRLPVWMGNMSSLSFLGVSHNGISGSLPPRFCSVAMELVILSNNKLDGSSAGTFHGCPKLVGLDLGNNSFTGTIPAGIGNMSRLSYLILRGNNLEGDIPLQLCNLTKLTFIDLSHNNLSGRVLPCFRCNNNHGSDMAMVLELSTKKRSYLYSGRILYNMSGIDISFNNLTGEIPPEIGNLTDLKLLNLSYNGLTGQIPTTFSNLKQVETMDLSHNNLAGNIPPELTELNSLALFDVAYNNLSGKIPYSRQFATFENNSYEGNPFLCGPPLTRACFSPESQSPFTKTPTDNDEESGFMDMLAFKVSFLVAYFMVVLAIASVLYINPQWRQAWFYFIGVIINNCYYFLVDNLPVPSRFRYWQPCI